MSEAANKAKPCQICNGPVYVESYCTNPRSQFSVYCVKCCAGDYKKHSSHEEAVAHWNDMIKGKK